MYVWQQSCTERRSAVGDVGVDNFVADVHHRRRAHDAPRWARAAKADTPGDRVWQGPGYNEGLLYCLDLTKTMRNRNRNKQPEGLCPCTVCRTALSSTTPELVFYRSRVATTPRTTTTTTPCPPASAPADANFNTQSRMQESANACVSSRGSERKWQLLDSTSDNVFTCNRDVLS